MLAEKLKNRNLILASASPRRQQFIKDLGLSFEVRLKPVEENFPETLKGAEIAEFLAELKAKPLLKDLNPEDILLTGDTIVWHENQVLHKPKNKDQAFEMLKKLSGNSHQVISAACLATSKRKVLVHDSTTVYFKNLNKEEINYYIENFNPYDKAGGYGIQEWIGKTGIHKIEGSFYTVMGMPIDKVYDVLKEI